jgi:hypothetical protein
MAKANVRKSSKAGKRDSYKGLPAKEQRRIVDTVIQFRKDAAEEKNAGKRAKLEKDRQIIEKQRAYVATQAREAFKHGLNNLACVGDLLEAIERGHEGLDYFEPDTLARFARTSMTESCREIEQSLCDMGLIEAGKYKGRFQPTDNLRSQMPKPQREGVRHG